MESAFYLSSRLAGGAVGVFPTLFHRYFGQERTSPPAARAHSINIEEK
jgi:hypothetical protein